MGTKSCTKTFNFSTRFLCEYFPIDDSVTVFMGGIYGEMFCSGMVPTNLYMLFYAGEVQNSNCPRLEVATDFSQQLGEICKSRQSYSSTVPQKICRGTMISGDPPPPRTAVSQCLPENLSALDSNPRLDFC